MKTRFYSRIAALFLVLATSAFSLSGCVNELVPIDVELTPKFGAIRVLHFAECQPPVDAFIYLDAVGPTDTSISRAVGYSVASVYSNNLVPGNYRVMITHLNRPGELASIVVPLASGQNKTVIIWDKEPGGSFDPELDTHEDKNLNQPLDPSKAYIRFINTKPGTKLSLKINNPLEAVKPELADVEYKMLKSYVGLNHALDTAYTLYVTDNTNGEDRIIARLANAAFSPGSTYTVTYAGNEGSCRDTTTAKGDTLRIRYFDDNEQGAEQTLPIPQSLRFNLVNAVVPPDPKYGQTHPDFIQRTYKNALSFTINNEKPYMFPNLPFGGVSNQVGTDGNVKLSTFENIRATDAVLVSAFNEEGDSASNKNFNAQMVGSLMMNRDLVKSDIPFSIIVLDTIRGDSVLKKPVIDKYRVFPVTLPDEPDMDSAHVVLVQALSNTPKNPAGPRSAKLRINGVATKQFNISRPAPFADNSGKVKPGQVTVTADIGTTSVLESVEPLTFTAEAGGIYEVILMGVYKHASHPPRLVVIRTNPVLGQ